MPMTNRPSSSKLTLRSWECWEQNRLIKDCYAANVAEEQGQEEKIVIPLSFWNLTWMSWPSFPILFLPDNFSITCLSLSHSFSFWSYEPGRIRKKQQLLKILLSNQSHQNLTWRKITQLSMMLPGSVLEVSVSP